jgi:hypothetical protein
MQGVGIAKRFAFWNAHYLFSGLYLVTRMVPTGYHNINIFKSKKSIKVYASQHPHAGVFLK